MEEEDAEAKLIKSGAGGKRLISAICSVMSVCLSVCLFVYLSAVCCLSLPLSVCQSVSLSVCLSAVFCLLSAVCGLPFVSAVVCLLIEEDAEAKLIKSGAGGSF
jgi:predicted neutral ceramidase superfamily lipid hydrolase